MLAARDRWGRYLWRKAVTCCCAVFLLVSCSQTSSTDRNDLSAMDTTLITIGDHTFEVWVADDAAERQLGLMQVTEGELASLGETDDQGGPIRRGMLFVFETDQPLAFWMYNTITPLDIAYIRSDGTIVRTYTMAPLETRNYPSVEPARFALEVLAGTFDELGIAAGDTVELPDAVLKRPGG